MTDSIIILSEDEEVYKSLKRALGVFEITANKWEDTTGKIPKRQPILVYADNRDLLYKWLWIEIRVHYKCLNPFIAISYNELSPTEDLRDLVFSKEWESYKYLQNPFSLCELSESINDLKPLENQDKDQRKQNVREYSQPIGLLNKAHHEVRGTLGSDEKDKTKRNLTVGFYTQVKELLQDLNCHKGLIEEANKIISKIERSKMSGKECTKFQSITDELFIEIANQIGGVLSNE
ncbi:MAG: hypothetical protein HOK80_06330 [Candidatus Cloacimonetes bacterium]|jgi:hypothetical protein|nr:hypothetical protein [Candidatus Cloacimonadota bacterium]